MSDHDLDVGGEGDIAIVGMAARLPGARNIEEYWTNLVNGVESVVFFDGATRRILCRSRANRTSENHASRRPRKSEK